MFWLLFIPATIALSVFYFTRHELKDYSSESVIYTGIASGYSLSGNNKADFFATSNAFDNLLSLINSRETKQEVALNLLAMHLMIKKHDPSLFSWDSFDKLRKLVPDSVRNMVVRPTLENTVVALDLYMRSKENNIVYQIINSENSFYSVFAMDKIKAIRINNSDLIKISYHTNDAVICRQTLELLEISFIKKHKLLKEGQSESVVTYFQTETDNAFKRLNEAEQNFMQFSKQNDIINYYEQTKAVAIEKENLDVQKQNIEMDKMASSKSLDKVNEDIKGRLYQTEYGAAILKERETLSEVYSKIAIGDLVGKNEAGHQQRMDSLRKVSVAMEVKLAGSVNKLYLQTLTPEGIPTKTVLDEWLRTSLAFEQSKARLTVMDKRKIEFSEQYRKYAPLGAMLKKIERQINVSEQEYLELLHGLNMAKLTQQNNELTTKLNIVDKPYLPLKANRSIRMMQVILAFVAGFVAVLAFIITRTLLNKTIQQPDRARKFIGIPLLGIYPLLNTPPAFIAKANLRLVQQLLSRINITGEPVIIGMLSVQNKEGKSTLIDMLNVELTNIKYTVEIRAWNSAATSTNNKPDIVLLEFPALDTLVIKPGLLPKLDHTFLVCRANRVWNTLDTELLNIFCKTTGNEPALILNGVKSDFAESYIGEVPAKRFFLRTFLKRLFKFQFGHRKQFT
ncbi:MAG: hypothetical protein ABIN89_22365 [Chitinophagaceae bacterium]